MKKSLVIAVLLCFYGNISLFCGGLFSKSPAGGVEVDKKVVFVATAKIFASGRKVALTSDSQEIDLEIEAPYCWDLEIGDTRYNDSPISGYAQFIFKFYFYLEQVLRRVEDRAERLACIVADLERYKKVAELPEVVGKILKDVEWYQQAHIEGSLDDSLLHFVGMVRAARDTGADFYRMRCAEKRAGK